MTMRVDRVVVAILGTIEFSGRDALELDWEPNADDPLVAALLERHRQMQQAQMMLAAEPFNGGPWL